MSAIGLSPQERQRQLSQFFVNSLWYGFTGTPIFEENKREQKGDLPQTTQEQYGDCLHQYTVKEAIHDKAVLGFSGGVQDHYAPLSRRQHTRGSLYR